MYISARAFKRIFSRKIWLRYSRERALSSLPDRTSTREQPRSFYGWRVAVHGDENEHSIVVPDDSRRKAFFPIHPHGGPRIMFDAKSILTLT